MMTDLEKLAHLLALQVTITDKAALAKITLEKIEAYAIAKGWPDTSWLRENISREKLYRQSNKRSAAKHRRIVREVLADLARIESRSPLAAYLELAEMEAANAG